MTMELTFIKTGRLRLPDGHSIDVAAGKVYSFDDVTAAWIKRNWPDWLEPEKPRTRRKPKRKPKRAAFDHAPVEK